MSQFQQDEVNEEESQMPLGTGGDAAPAEDYVESKPRVNNSTVALFGAFAVALVVLYLLGLQNKPRAASAEDTQRWNELNARIESLIQGTEGTGPKIDNFFDTTSRLIAKLKERFEQQSGEVELGASPNPFEQHVVTRVEDPKVGEVPRLITEDPAKAALLRKLADEFDKLKLDGVMMSNSPTALINRNIVGVGEKLGSFTVTGIKDGEVLLNYQNDKPKLNETFRLVDKKKP